MPGKRKAVEVPEVAAPPPEHIALVHRLGEHEVQATAIPAGLLILNPEKLAELLDRLKEAEAAAYLKGADGEEPWETYAALRPSPHPVPVHRVDNLIGALQEWVMRRHPGKPEMWPVYTEESVGNVHAPLFRASVRLPGTEGFTASAEAPQKQAAKRQAAQKMLAQLAEQFGAERTSA